MAGLKIKEAELVDELTDDCVFPISDSSGKPRAASFTQIKMSAREIAEDVLGEFGETNLDDYLKKNDAKGTYATIESLNKKANKSTVDILIGNDVNKSMRTIANEVLAGASTGGEIDLSLYLSKSEAESTYATKESLETANDSIDSIDTRLGKAETNISNNSNLLSSHSQQIATLQTRQESQKDTIQQQGATILALDLEVDGVKGDISEVNTAIEALETALKNKAEKSTVDSLSKDLVSTKAVVEIIAPQVNANADAIKSKASQEEVNALSESVTTLEGSVEEISNRVDDKADKGEIQTLVNQINNKVEQTTYNNKVAELEASIKTNKDNIDKGIVYLEGYSEGVANEAEARAKAYADSLAGNYDASGSAAGALSSAKTYTDEEIAKVDTKADNALDKANKAIEDISKLDASVKSSFDDLGETFETLDSVITGINTTATNALTKATEVEGDVDNLAKDVESNTKTIAEHTEIVTMLNNRCDSIEDTAEELESQIFQIETNVTSLDEHIDEVEAKADNVLTQLSGVVGDVQTAKATANDAKAIAQQAKDKANTNADNITSIGGKVKTLENTISTLDTTITEVGEKAEGAINTANNASAQASELAGIVTENTNKINTLIGTDKSTSVRDIANNAINQKTISLEDAATSQEDDGLVTAKDAIAYFGGKITDAISKEVTRADKTYATKDAVDDAVVRIEGEIADIEANMSSLEDDIKYVENTLGTLNTTITQVSTKADNAVSQAESAKELAETASQNADKANNTINGLTNTVSDLRTTVEGHTSKIADNKAKIEAIEEDYISKGDAVDFATDLTGVVEATAEEFVYRPSAGEKSIRDKSAVIRRIKGNSVVWEQKLLPLTSDNWNQYSATYANIVFADNAATLTLTAAYTGQNVYNIGLRYNPPTTQKYLSGHVYLIVGLCKLQSDGKLLIQMADQNFETNKISASPNEWVSFGAIGSLTNDASKFYIKPPFSYTYLREGSSYSVRNVMLFDLTTMFGAGNEPATVEEFRTIYNEAYYPYCQPELRSMKTWGIKTVGFNLFDGECARVIGGMSYIVSNYTLAFYSESKGGTQTEAPITGGIYTPECSGYLYLTPTKDSDATPCVHFQHSGVMDDKCAPYVAHWLELPEILTLFPNGMNAVGNVFDEINIDTYIKRCEYRDYVEGDESNAEVLTDGVHTVAKLAEPVVKVLPEPITWDYYCEDWGSEEARPKEPSTPSAPFRADIVYQFNAEGRIRDNSRNIDKLEKIVAPLKVIPSNTPLATQGFVLSHIPTRVATATERRKMSAEEALLALSPNIMYDWTDSSLVSITIPSLYINPETIGTYDHQWMVRVTTGTSDSVIIPFDVLWKDGIAPNWTTWCICEITFKCAAPQDEAFRKIIGEWKIYK